MFRTALTKSVSRTTFVAVRPIHSTSVAFKSVTETVKDVADAVNKKVGQGLASAIDTGEKTAEKTKETVGATTEKAKQKASETGEFAGQKANQAETGARQAKQDFEKEVKK